jgi:hypothetical protein
MSPAFGSRHPPFNDGRGGLRGRARLRRRRRPPRAPT